MDTVGRFVYTNDPVLHVQVKQVPSSVPCEHVSSLVRVSSCHCSFLVSNHSLN